MEWYSAESTAEEKPKELDITSSPETVYMRRNITQQPVIDEEGEEVGKKWVYKECTQNKAEYEQQQATLTSPVTTMIMQEIASLQLAQAETQITLELMGAEGV